MSRLLLRQLRPHVASIVLLALAAALLAAGLTVLPRVLSQVADERFAAAFDVGSVATLTVSGEPAETADPATVIGSLSTLLEQYPSTVDAPLDDALGEVDWQLALEPEGVGVPTAAEDAVQFTLGISPTLDEHAEIAAGAAPGAWVGAGPLEIAVSQAVADRLRLSVGDSLDSDLAPLVISGIIAPLEDVAPSPGDLDRFAAPVEEPLLAGGAKVTARGWVDEGGAAALGASLARSQLTAWYPIDGGGLGPADIPALSDVLRAASSARIQLPDAAPLNVSSRLAVALDALEAADAALAAVALLIASAPLGGLAATVLLAAQAFAARRSTARRLLGARGAGVARLARDGAFEAAIPVAPAAILGAGAAVLLVPGEDGAAVFLPTIVVAAATVVVGAVLATRADARLSVHPAVRLVAELAVLAGAGVSLALLVQRGLAITASGVDPLLAAAPLLAALAVSVLLVRALPWVLRSVERVLSRGRGAVSLVAVARVVRSATLGLAAMLAIVIAVSATTLSATLSATMDAGAATAARQSVGADLRIDADGMTLPSAEEVAGMTGVAAAVEVRRLTGAVLAEEGRERAALVLVADASRWNATRPDLELPAGSGGTLSAVISDRLTNSDDSALTLDRALLERSAVAPTTALPTDGDSWVLIDDAAVLGGPDSVGEWMLVRTDPGVSTVEVASQVHDAFGAGLHIVEVDSTRAAVTDQPAFSALRSILHIGAGLSLVLALLAAAMAVIGAAVERSRTLAALRLVGMPARRAIVVVLWEVLPGTIAATAAGSVLGVALATLLVSAADLGSAVGGVALTVDAPIGSIVVAALAFIIVITAAGAVFAAGSARFPPRSTDRMRAS